MAITSEILLQAYENGFFPMAESRSSNEINWYCPEMRGILPLEDFHVPKKLTKLYNQHPFDIRIDTSFRKVITSCAELNEDRRDTWINDIIINLFCELHEDGHAHSVECFLKDELVGGLYGVSIGGVFCGESMFSRRENASKIALVYLADRLKEKGYVLLDTQYINDHLKQFGAIEIEQKEYLKRLDKALGEKVSFI